VILKFGKYQGRPLDEAPLGYLTWCLENSVFRSASEHEAVMRHVDERLERFRSYDGRRPANLDTIIWRWYRQLALKYHPDRGGSHEAMIAVTEAKELLEEMLQNA
jgi:hypothetical protein